MNKEQQWYSSAIAFVLVAIVAISSFALSFTNITIVSQEFYGNLAPLLPIIIDLGLVLFIIARFTATFSDDTTTRRWALVLSVIAALSTLVFNQFSTLELFVVDGVDSSQNQFDIFVSFLVHLMPPMLLLATVEITVLMIKGLLKYRGVVFSLNKLMLNAGIESENLITEAKTKVRKYLEDEENLIRIIQQKQETISELELSIANLNEENAQILWKRKLSQLSTKELSVLQAINLTQREIEQKTNIPLATVNHIITKLKKDNYIIYNKELSGFQPNRNGVEYEGQTN